MSLTIGIAGASGFVGRNLIKKLKESYLIKAMSRSHKNEVDNIKWVQVDLFSYNSTLHALKDVDVALYLVHSMLPSTKLFQGNFQDTDLLLADNFSKACIENNVQQIIYLGGLAPEGKISKHLESRLEVEKVFEMSKVPTTILRAGMVVGDGGSSFEILKNLVLNLPAMILPKWTKSHTQAIFIDDLVNVLEAAIGNHDFYSQTFNVVNGERITYAELIKQTSTFFHKEKPVIPVPINYLSLSKLWVKIFGETDYELVSPLIDSLQCDLPTPPIPDLLIGQIKYRTYLEMLKNISKEKTNKSKNKNKSNSNEDNTVRSIQRLNHVNLTEKSISEEYFNWLPQKLSGLLRAEKNGGDIDFVLIGLKVPLLRLRKIEEDGSLNRIKFHIVGGLLSKTKDTGWLEFRSVANGAFVLASINDFVPSLPWYIYKYTQAPIHEFVMNEFSKHLKKIDLHS
jgi:uncharacterized protein YbjT (DUF2867 family)